LSGHWRGLSILQIGVHGMRSDTPQKPGRHSVILCHPDSTSFNHSIAAAYCTEVRARGQQVVLRDLYAMNFDPVLKASERPTVQDFNLSADVTSELDVIRGSDVFVLVYPIWFGTPPAMLKGYVERVLGAGVAPDAIRENAPSALLGNKRLLSISTSALDSVWLNEQGQETALEDVFDHYLLHAFGMHSQRHMRIAHITPALSDHFANQHLYDVEEQARQTCAQIAFGDEALHDNPKLADQLPALTPIML
jgi:NAD(P)H dehydrogenase (quinone)